MISLHSRFFQMLIRTVTIKFCLGVGVGSTICVFPQDVLFLFLFFAMLALFMLLPILEHISLSFLLLSNAYWSLEVNLGMITPSLPMTTHILE